MIATTPLLLLGFLCYCCLFRPLDRARLLHSKKKVLCTQVLLQTFAVNQEYSAAKQATEYVQTDQLLSKRVLPQCNHTVGLQPLPTPQNRRRSLRKA